MTAILVAVVLLALLPAVAAADTGTPTGSINDALLGPYGALLGAIIVIGFLGRLLTQYIADLRATRDLALTGWRDQTAATNAVADAVAERNRTEATRALVEQARAEGADAERTRAKSRAPAGRSD